jgi:hypothetical protein
MAEFRDRLVQLYAANKVDTVGNVQAFRQLCAEFSRDHNFDTERDRVESAKVIVEQHLDRPGLTQEESVRKAIQLLVSNRRDKKRVLSEI